MTVTDRREQNKAAALGYNQREDEAPRVLASGKGRVAERIVEIARDAEVPIVEDAALVSALLVLELGEEIPEELYETVARILAFIYNVDREYRP
ncbi:MAG: EscU/YscU/HrcU family type III secretion system export apparatus switch protein [Synergistales bacterium]|nr:EscU/YscU/HrcU family type III secretion system export apparatus switch protein [Synergistales bacterium]